MAMPRCSWWERRRRRQSVFYDSLLPHIASDEPIASPLPDSPRDVGDGLLLLVNLA
jgi:hypothetical protein